VNESLNTPQLAGDEWRKGRKGESVCPTEVLLVLMFVDKEVKSGPGGRGESRGPRAEKRAVNPDVLKSEGTRRGVRG